MKKINSSAVISVLFLLGILVMVNTIGTRLFMRLDLTSSKMFTLSKASKDIVSNIEDRLVIKAYISPNLPAPYNNVERYLRDILEDYKAYSKGHLVYEFIDPGSEEKLEREAQSFRIPPRQFQVVANDKVEFKMGYMGVVFLYGDKKEVIPVVNDIGNLEYEVTSLINRLTSTKLPKLGIASTGTESQGVTMQKLYEALGRNFDIQPISMDETISKDLEGVMLIAPRERLTEWQLFNLDQYIMNGGKLGVFANAYEPILQQGFSRYRDLNLKNFLANYGVTINDDMAYDEKCAAVSVPRTQGFFKFNQNVQVPFLVSILSFNKSSAITRGLDYVQTYFPSTVDTTFAAKLGYVAEGLLYTSDLSGSATGPSIMLDITRNWTKEDFNMRGLPIAAISRGKFKSYFAQSGPPNKPNIYMQGAVDTVGTKYEGEFKAISDNENRLIVVGDGNMTIDQYIQNGGPGTITFLQNAADWLAQTESLISIRSKVVLMKPLKEVPNFAKKLIKWSNQIGPVILVIALGIVLWQFRLLRKRRLVAQGGKA